jgi:hypothetical protein
MLRSQQKKLFSRQCFQVTPPTHSLTVGHLENANALIFLFHEFNIAAFKTPVSFQTYSPFGLRPIQKLPLAIGGNERIPFHLIISKLSIFMILSPFFSNAS